MSDLSGAFTKLLRAQHHLESIETALLEFQNNNPQPFRHEKYDDGRSWTLFWNFDPLPDLARWSAMFGDFVHNLRSSLDHAIWQLILRENGQPGRRTEFPIFNDAARFRGEASRKMYGLNDPDVRALIERYQPFQGSWGVSPDPLWFVHECDRTDKHQQLHVVVQLPGLMEIAATVHLVGAVTPSEAPITFSGAPAEHGAAFATITPGQPSTKVDMTLTVAVEAGIEVMGSRFRMGQALDTSIKSVGRILSEIQQAFF